MLMDPHSRFADGGGRLSRWCPGAARIALAVCLIGALGLDRPAYAYLDPGTGSVMLQLILGGAAGVMVVARLYWSKLKGLVRGRERQAASRVEPE